MNPIDWAASLRLANGDAALAKELLSLFIKHLPEAQRDIQLACQKQNYSALAGHVHKLYGACCYCAVPLLSAVLVKLQSALDLKQWTELNSLQIKIDETAQAVQEEYKRLLANGVL
ncbi:MAG: Hpt domain-containing protein [Gammaproteobacteria bacterium]|nr:Hpt domain-containing protein [Gammaproteobacteria bacterium]